MRLLGTICYYILIWPVVKLFLVCRYIYREFWLRFLFWFNKTSLMGGLAEAGERGRQSRIFRLIGNGITLLGFGLGIVAIGASIWFTGGLALPLWATGLIMLGVTMNLIALPFGSSANTIKIQTYYDAEWDLQLLNNEKATIDQEPPHGLQSPFRQQAMLGFRYGHDVNGLMGTMASWVGTIVDVISAFIMPVAATVGSLIFLISRASGLVSAGGAPFTNQHRLWVHKKNIKDQITVYYDLAKLNSEKQHQHVEKIINDAFVDLKLKKTDHHYAIWIKFRCYRAVERALTPQSELTDADIKRIVTVFMQDFCKPSYTFLHKISTDNADENPAKELDGKQIKQILKHNASDSKEPTNHPDVCVLDAMPYFEERLYQKLRDSKSGISVKSTVEQFVKTYFKVDHEGHTALFTDYLVGLLLDNGAKAQSVTLCKDLYLVLVNRLSSVPYITYHAPYWSLDTQKLIDTWPIETSHGKQFVATYQLKQLAILFKDCYLQQVAKDPVKQSSQQQSAANIALEIWLSIIREAENDAPEGKYDDHDPIFHGIRIFCLKYMTDMIKQKQAKGLDKQNINELKIRLKAYIKEEVEQHTYISSFNLLLHKYAKRVGHKYFNVPQEKEAPLAPEEPKLETEWLNQGRSFARHLSLPQGG